jgi:hypothetical protein
MEFNVRPARGQPRGASPQGFFQAKQRPRHLSHLPADAPAPADRPVVCKTRAGGTCCLQAGQSAAPPRSPPSRTNALNPRCASRNAAAELRRPLWQ